jgi:hypothetical protein
VHPGGVGAGAGEVSSDGNARDERDLHHPVAHGSDPPERRSEAGGQRLRPVLCVDARKLTRARHSVRRRSRMTRG